MAFKSKPSAFKENMNHHPPPATVDVKIHTGDIISVTFFLSDFSNDVHRYIAQEKVTEI